MKKIAPVLSAKSLLSIFSVLVLCLGCLYTLPYHIPLAAGGVSDAYALGWNTKASWITLLITSSAFALYTRGFGITLSSEECRRILSHRLLAASLLITFCCCVYEWYCARTFEAVQESQFFLNSYQRYSLGGQLYKNFDFYYGQLMFYPAVWSTHLFPRLHYGDSYFLSWTLQWLLGAAVLWKLVDLSLASKTRASLIFFAIAMLNLPMIFSLGINYTPLRYSTTLLFALLVERAYRGGQNLYVVFGMASVGGIVSLLYTPEAGVQFFLGTMLFFVFCAHSRRKELPLPLLLFGLVMLLAFYLAYRSGEFDLALQTASGGLNFPLVFGVNTLVPVLIIFCGACIFFSAAKNHQLSHPLVYLLLLALTSIPAAMGRCDPGHILMNTMGALIAVLVVLNQYRFFPWVLVLFIAFLCFLERGIEPRIAELVSEPLRQTVIYDQQKSFVGKIYRHILIFRHGQENAAGLIAGWQKDESWHQGGKLLPEGSVLFAPMGAPLTVLAVGDPRIDPGFFPGLLPLSDSFMHRKMEEIQRHSSSLLLLPENWDSICNHWSPESSRIAVRYVFGPSIIPSVKHSPMDPRPMCQYIKAHYAGSEYASPLPKGIIYKPIAEKDADLPDAMRQ